MPAGPARRWSLSRLPHIPVLFTVQILQRPVACKEWATTSSGQVRLSGVNQPGHARQARPSLTNAASLASLASLHADTHSACTSIPPAILCACLHHTLDPSVGWCLLMQALSQGHVAPGDSCRPLAQSRSPQGCTVGCLQHLRPHPGSDHHPHAGPTTRPSPLPGPAGPCCPSGPHAL